MKKVLFGGILLTLTMMLVVSGCSNTGVKRHGPQGEQEYSYYITITKSAGNSFETQVLSTSKKLTMQELLDEATIDFSTENRSGRQVMTELDGVMSTVQRAWNLYIENKLVKEPTVEGTLIKPNSDVEWVYEKTNVESTPEFELDFE